MRKILPVVAALLCLWSGPAFPQAADSLRVGLEHLRANRCDKARESFTKALESDWITPNQRGTAHMLRGLCGVILEDNKAARADLDEAVRLMDEPGPALGLRADLAWWTDDREQSFRDTLRLAREFPGELGKVGPREIWRLWRWLRDEKRDDDRFALLEAVVKADYRPGKPGQSADSLIQEYVRMLIGKDRANEALPLALKITGVRLLFEMRVSGDFRPLWKDARFDAHSEPRSAAERERDYWKAQAEKYPKSLAVVMNRIQNLRMLGEFDDAIAMARKAVDNPGAYEDDKVYLAWVRNELVYALLDAGRIEDSVAAMTPLLERTVEQDSFLVSQFINFSIVMMYAGEDQRAIDTALRARGHSSPFGEKWIDSTLVCANHALGRTDEAEAALKRLRTKPEENYAALSRALLCLDRVDEAVKLTLVRLRDPDSRQSALMTLQNFREQPKMPPRAVELTARFKALRGHPEVVAEAQKHGRLLDIPLYPVYWGDV